MIKKLAYLTATRIVNEDNLSHISEVLSKKKNKEITLTRDEAVEGIAHAAQIFYSEMLKIILLLIISKILNIILPTFIIMIVFSTFRLVAGGEHMNTYLKCLVTTLILFLGGGLLVKHLISYNPMFNILFVSVTFVIGYTLINKYAPKDTVDKPITKEDDIKIFKKLSLIYIIVVTISTMTLYKNNLVVLSIIFGIVIEIWTITPIGVKFFMIANKLSTKNKHII